MRCRHLRTLPVKFRKLAQKAKLAVVKDKLTPDQREFITDFRIAHSNDLDAIKAMEQRRGGQPLDKEPEAKAA